MKPIVIIEHLEPKLWPWCLIEYKSLSKIVGKRNLWFTNIHDGAKKLALYGTVIRKSVKDLHLDLTTTCVLDPLAKKQLTPKEATSFKYFIFGGILGEEQLNGRTKEELTHFLKKAHQRNLGNAQFSTDNAVYVTNKIAIGTPLAKIPLKNTIEIPITNIESVILPYAYPLIKGKPRISQELIHYLKNKKGF